MNAKFGKGKHAILSRVARQLHVYCDECYDLMMGGKDNNVKKKVSRMEEPELHHTRYRKRYSDEYEDKEEEELSIFDNFFKSAAGKAVRIMLKHINHRLDDIEKNNHKNNV